MTSPEKQLKQLRKESAAPKQFKKELWSELSLAWDNEYPAMRFSFRKMIAVPVAVLVVFFTMGTGVYAYASPEVTEDTALYPVKRSMEEVEQLWHRSPESKSRFHARMVERRIEEGEVMLRRGTITRNQLIEIANELDYTIEDFIEAKEDPALREEIQQDFEDEIFERIETQNSRFDHLIERVREEKKEHGLTNGELRNKFQDIRVRLDESDLTPEEKRALFLDHLDEPERPSVNGEQE